MLCLKGGRWSTTEVLAEEEQFLNDPDLQISTRIHQNRIYQIYQSPSEQDISELQHCSAYRPQQQRSKNDPDLQISTTVHQSRIYQNFNTVLHAYRWGNDGPQQKRSTRDLIFRSRSDCIKSESIRAGSRSKSDLKI